MRKPSGCGFGCGFFLFGLFGLCLLVSLPSMITDSPLINGAMGQIFCGDADAYINDSYRYSYRPGTITWSLNAKCQTSDNRIEDISDKQTGIGLAVFIISTLIGVIGFLNLPTPTPAIPKGTKLTLNGVPIDQLDTLTSTPQGKADDQSLKDRLRQLEESYEAGLINKEEYDDTRKRLLDNL